MAKRNSSKKNTVSDTLETRMVAAAVEAGFENAKYDEGELTLTDKLSIEFDGQGFTPTRLIEGVYHRETPVATLAEALTEINKPMPEPEAPAQTEEIELTEQSDDFSDDLGDNVEGWVPEDMEPYSTEAKTEVGENQGQRLIQVDPPEVPETVEMPETAQATIETPEAVETAPEPQEAEEPIEEKTVYVTKRINGVITAIPITEAVPVGPALVETPAPAPAPTATMTVALQSAKPPTATTPATTTTKAKKEPEVLTVCYDLNSKDQLLEMARKWQAEPKKYPTKKLTVQFGYPGNWNAFWEVLKKTLVAAGEWQKA